MLPLSIVTAAPPPPAGKVAAGGKGGKDAARESPRPPAYFKKSAMCQLSPRLPPSRIIRSYRPPPPNQLCNHCHDSRALLTHSMSFRSYPSRNKHDTQNISLEPYPYVAADPPCPTLPHTHHHLLRSSPSPCRQLQGHHPAGLQRAAGWRLVCGSELAGDQGADADRFGGDPSVS